MRTVSLSVGFGFWLAFAPPAGAQVQVRFEEPGRKFSQVTGAAVETFDSPALLGSYGPTSPASGFAFSGAPSPGGYSTAVADGMRVREADVNGGANGSNYLVVPSGGTTTLTLANPQGIGYFGLYLTAGDNSNRIDFQRSDGAGGFTTTFTFNVTTLLRSNQLTPFGTPGGSHYGSPEPGTAGQNSGEAYVFLNFYPETGADRFERVVLTQNGTGFESDNHTVFDDFILPGDRTGTVVSAIPVPEPAGLLALAGLAGAGWLSRNSRGRCRTG